jgi:hypothetical protein
MGLVDDESSAVSLGHSCKLWQGSKIAVHAEEGFSHDEPSAGSGTESREVPFGNGKVEMGIDGKLGVGEATAVDNAGMDRVVRDYEIFRTGEGSEDADVCQVPRGV